MQLSQIPTKFNIPWANGAANPYIRPIPQNSQIGIQNGAASLVDGFPPLTFLQVAAGGVPPFGADTNGILNQITSWIRWASAGAPIQWDSAFSAAIGGYPQYALVQSVTTPLLWWISQVDNNTSNPDTGGANWLGVNLGTTIPMGEVYFSFTSGSSCTLSPVNGGYIWINGLNYAVPSAGVNFAYGTTANNSLQYAYVRLAGGTLVGDFSTTGYALNANGMPQKIGDATRTLVGMVQTGAGVFVWSDGARQVKSWFNRTLTRSRSQFSTVRTSTSGSFVEINTEIRNFFLVWAGENISWSTSGNFGMGASGNAATQMSFDSGATELETSVIFTPVAAGGQSDLNIAGIKTGLSEGLHYATLFGATTSSAFWNAVNSLSQSITSITMKLMA